MDDLKHRLRKGDPFSGVMQQAADRIEALEAQVKAADALASSGDALALRLRHVVGRECIVERWEARLAAYRATKEGGA